MRISDWSSDVCSSDLACWLDLLGYGGAIDKAGFDPAHPLAQLPLRRLRAFHRIVSKHSSAGFPTLVMNDGAVAYSNVELVRSDKVWRSEERRVGKGCVRKCRVRWSPYT